ncbi:MAG: crossover junction endodeoxyribonuclease RuvC [candidate division Zixibacteria bacterium 4484_95]|nr:MAG: crossover junction endodeoxyribonuclease RuvC [candidate division Zixibacteria bacterium 4484_95]RKX17131.1 MAG: crossover junction endodeoxyribonuclease RuvC [candidate division Zixibacteria bacterium]
MLKKAYKGSIYVGIDPGLDTTGYGVLECSGDHVKLKEAGVIKTRRRLPLEERLAEIFSSLNEVFDEYKPRLVVIEDLYSHYRHPKTAIIMGHARGAVFLSAAHSKIPVKSYGATMVKKSLTGNGRASKHQVQYMVRDKLGLNNIPESPDVADALAVALCHINHLNNKRETIIDF